MNNYPASEKIVVIINECLNRHNHVMTVSEIITLFDCSRKTASRLIDKIYDMRFEISFIDVEVIPGVNCHINKKIKIVLSKKI